MFGRGTLLLLVLMAAVALPYLLFEENSATGQKLRQWWDSATLEPGYAYRGHQPIPSASPMPPSGGFAANRNVPDGIATGGGFFMNSLPLRSSQGVADYRLPTWNAPVPGTPVGPSPRRTTYPNIQNISELFRFSITPEWVIQHWPRVSSQNSEFKYSGLRVPIISGTQTTDLAGSLTYYFDQQRQLQRISFFGATGDPQRIINLAVGELGMAPIAALGGYCYAVQDQQEQLQSILRVRNAPISVASRPNRRYRLELELNRPGSQSGLSNHMSRSLENERRMTTPRGPEKVGQGGE